jgi:hypothetical protein
VLEEKPLEAHLLLPHTWRYATVRRAVYATFCCGCEWNARWLKYLYCCKRRKPPAPQDTHHLDAPEKVIAPSVAVGAVLKEVPAQEVMAMSPRRVAEPAMAGASPMAQTAMNSGARKETGPSEQKGDGHISLEMAPLQRTTTDPARMPGSPPARPRLMSCSTVQDSRESVLSITCGDADPTSNSGENTTRHFRVLTIQQALGTDIPVVQTHRRASTASEIPPLLSAPTMSPNASAHLRLQAQARQLNTVAEEKQEVPMELPRLPSIDEKMEVAQNSSVDLTAKGAASKPDATVVTATAGTHVPEPSTPLLGPSSPPDASSDHLVTLHPDTEVVPASADQGNATSTTSASPAPADTVPTAPVPDVKTVPVTVVPVQEGVPTAQQVLVQPPRNKLRFQHVEWILELIFPPIRLLGANAVDGFIYLKYSQINILMVAIMTVIALPVLLPVHEQSVKQRARMSKRGEAVVRTVYH